MRKSSAHKDSYISFLVFSATNMRHRQFKTHNDMFKNEFKVTQYYDKIIFTIATIDDNKTYKSCKSRRAYGFSVPCQIQNGRYYFDTEESSEDRKVIYLSDVKQ
jgi:hypothetical protein